MVEFAPSGSLQYVPEALGYLPIDLGDSSHPPLSLTPERLWIGIVDVLGEPV
jgi:hypothetical protein